MKNKYYEVALIVPSVSQNISLVRKFAGVLRTYFPRDVLPEVQIYGWVEIDTVALVLCFQENGYTPEELRWLGIWISELNVKMIELDRLVPAVRETVEKAFMENSEVRYHGAYDLERAVWEISDTFALYYDDVDFSDEDFSRMGPPVFSPEKSM